MMLEDTSLLLAINISFVDEMGEHMLSQLHKSIKTYELQIRAWHECFGNRC